MDDNLENRPVETTSAPEAQSNKSPDVGFPLSPRKPKSKSGVWIFIIVLIIILAGGLVFFLSKGKGNSTEPSPTPETQETQTPESTPIPSPLASPSAVIKAKVTVEVQNGTGITGEAAYLQGILKGMGYTSVKVGNSSSQNNVNTTVSFSDTLDKSVVQDITNQLDLIYQQVDTQISSTITTDVLIVTGLRKGSTAKPSAVASSTPTATPTATP